MSSREWAGLRRRVFDRDGWRCGNCGRAAALECHHVIPLMDGGTNVVANLASVCRDCHILAHRAMKPVNPWDDAVAALELDPLTDAVK